MKRFICNFYGEDIFLDDEDENQARAINLIKHLNSENEILKEDSVDASMYRLISKEERHDANKKFNAYGMAFIDWLNPCKKKS